MLQDQISPHFIYNTLDTINWTASERLGTDNNVSEMITTLAALLRLSLSNDNFLVSVAEEIDHAKLYLFLFEQRYKNRLHIHWDVNEGAMHCKILKLSLQPLIENSLNHGLRAHRYYGKIQICVLLDSDTLLVSVEDDGIGMEDTSFANINQQLQQESDILHSIDTITNKRYSNDRRF